MKRKYTAALFFQVLYHWRLSILSFFSTAWCRFFFRFLGIGLQNGSTFYGIPMVYFYSGSKILIGKDIRIRTSRNSNLIGMNRRTIIATHSKSAEIIIGDHCGFSAVVLGAKESIKIGNDVIVGANVLITDFDWHAINPGERRHGIPESSPVVIANNVFIGYSSTILKGVTIGENSVIGANSVVTKNIPANVIAAGNPCRVIKAIS